jgi:hypothetical protein
MLAPTANCFACAVLLLSRWKRNNVAACHLNPLVVVKHISYSQAGLSSLLHLLLALTRIIQRNGNRLIFRLAGCNLFADVIADGFLGLARL